MTPSGKAGPERNPPLQERLIKDGIAAADRRATSIDHVTARRIALWLLPGAMDEPFLRGGLIRFAQNGAITDRLPEALRQHLRSPLHQTRFHTVKLSQYVAARGANRDPIGNDFAATCDEIDRTDAMLLAFRQHLQDGAGFPDPGSPGNGTQRPVALTRYDPVTRTFRFVLDADTANAAIHAITINALEREAHAREVQLNSQHLPEDTYGRRNREDIALRETQTAARLRAIERAYRTSLDHNATPAPEPTEISAAVDGTRDQELEPG
jgi:hypothetical protein